MCFARVTARFVFGAHVCIACVSVYALVCLCVCVCARVFLCLHLCVSTCVHACAWAFVLVSLCWYPCFCPCLGAIERGRVCVCVVVRCVCVHIHNIYIYICVGAGGGRYSASLLDVCLLTFADPRFAARTFLVTPFAWKWTGLSTRLAQPQKHKALAVAISIHQIGVPPSESAQGQVLGIICEPAQSQLNLWALQWRH